MFDQEYVLDSLRHLRDGARVGCKIRPGRIPGPAGGGYGRAAAAGSLLARFVRLRRAR